MPGRCAAHMAAAWIDWTTSSSTRFHTTPRLCRRQRVTGCSASRRASWRWRSSSPRFYWTVTSPPLKVPPKPRRKWFRWRDTSSLVSKSRGTKTETRYGKWFRWRTGRVSDVDGVGRTRWWRRWVPGVWRSQPLAWCATLMSSC